MCVSESIIILWQQNSQNLFSLIDSAECLCLSGDVIFTLNDEEDDDDDDVCFVFLSLFDVYFSLQCCQWFIL